MSDLVETLGGELKIFSRNNGQYIIREDKLLAALGLAPNDFLTGTFRDLFKCFGARRRLGKLWLLDLHTLVEQILPTYLSDFSGNEDDELVTARAKNILQVLREQLNAYKNILRTKIIRAIPKVKMEPAGTITVCGESVPVVKDSAGNRWLRYKDFFAVLGFDKPSCRTTDTSLSHYLQDHARLKKTPVNGHSSIVINVSTLVEDVLPKLLDGQIQLLKIDELRGRIQEVLDDLQINLDNIIKAVQPKEEEKMLPEEKTTPATDKLSMDDLIVTLSLVSEVPAISFAEIIAKFKREKFEAEVDKRRAGLHKELEDFLAKYRS